MYLYSYPSSAVAWTDTSNITIAALPNAFAPNSMYFSYNPANVPSTYNNYRFGMVDFRLYGRALSRSEITQLYTQYNSYSTALAIPTSTTEIVAGDLGVTGNVVALRNIGIGTTTPQYNLDVSGTMNVSGTLSRSYQVLPLFNNPNQVGYTLSGTFVAFDDDQQFGHLFVYVDPSGRNMVTECTSCVFHYQWNGHRNCIRGIYLR